TNLAHGLHLGVEVSSIGGATVAGLRELNNRGNNEFFRHGPPFGCVDFTAAAVGEGMFPGSKILGE
ncbi:MAG: hypothetical protein ACK53Y_25955, partial [bacterium]